MFNALTRSMLAEAANYPFCTIDPNTGIVPVPDPRLDKLAELNSAKKKVGTTIEFVDIAGLVKGASEGKGRGNAFLSNIRMTDAIVQVVRCFEDDNVVHVENRVDALSDMEVINYELALADLAQVEKRLAKYKTPPRDVVEKQRWDIESGALHRITKALDNGQPARSVELSKDEAVEVANLRLLSLKPMIYAANVGEDELADGGASNTHVQALKKRAAEEGADVVVMSAKLEEELNGLAEDEAAAFLQELGVQSSGLDSLIRAAYHQLGLRTFFTAGPLECRAWTIRAGYTAPEAAGVIHSDFERGFIKAETIAYADYIKYGSEKACKENGVLRLEGKDYVVQEADVILFKFNVTTPKKKK